MAFRPKGLSEKQRDFLFNSDAFVNIMDGSIRSGKTFISIVRWIWYVAESPHDMFLMSGSTVDSLYRNVISDMLQVSGDDSIQFFNARRGGSQVVIQTKDGPKVCYCRGGGSVEAKDAITGATFGGWYADEITLHHREFLNMALGRLSLEGAKAFWTCNPRGPFNHIKTDFIDRVGELGYKRWHFVLSDNPALSKEYIDNISKAYTGLWYKRYILGQWVLAEGVVYDMFNAEQHVYAYEHQLQDEIIACDYGIANPTVFLHMGRIGEQVYVRNEYYHSGKETGRNKTDNEYLEELKKFVVGKNIQYVIVDPSAKSFIVLLRKEGFRVLEAQNAVLDGIRTVARFLMTGKLLFHPSCKNTFTEFSNYSWDEKAQEKGIDQPVKAYDHCMDALRYGIYTYYKEGGVEPKTPIVRENTKRIPGL